MSRISFLVHFAVSHLFMLALPLVNVGLAVFHMKLSTQADSADLISTTLTASIGVTYSAWLQRKTATVAHATGFAKALATVAPEVVEPPQSPAIVRNDVAQPPAPQSTQSNTPMKNILAFLTVCAFALSLSACGVNKTADLSTTAGNTSATLASNPGIGAGAIITTTNTLTVANAVISSVDTSGTNVVITPAAIGTGTLTLTFKNTVAFTFKNDLASYTQTVVNFAYTEGPTILADAGNVAKLTGDLAGDLQAWGLDPVTAGQASVLGNIMKITSKVATSTASLTSTLSGIQATGIVPGVTVSRSPNSSMIESDPQWLVEARRDEWRMRQLAQSK